MVADHLSRLVPESNSHGVPIGDSFPDEQLFSLVHCLWYADIVNYLVTGQFQHNGLLNRKRNFWKILRNITLMIHIYLNTVQTN